MKIKQHNITIRDLVEGYKDDGEGGVVGYSGKLDIRPPYQREFIYGGEPREKSITRAMMAGCSSHQTRT